MNRIEANLSLLAITFFAALQYIFLQAVPETVSNFAFLFVTNLIGLAFTLLFFGEELFRIDRKQVLLSALLAAELFAFNILLLMGSKEIDASAVAGIAAMYFVFIPVILVLQHRKVSRNSIEGTILVLAGVFITMGLDLKSFLNVHVIYLVMADLCVALNLLSIEKYCQKSNPAILAMGEMFFGSIFALIGWCTESAFSGSRMSLPSDPAFWSSVFFISVFIRGLYGVVQIYAQRYVTALNASLIFSTEVIITLVFSPLLARQMGMTAQPFTLLKLVGCFIIVGGVLTADGLPQQLIMTYKGKRPARRRPDE